MTESGSEREPVSTRELKMEELLRRVLAGPGSGAPCAHCHQVIGAGEIEYEIIESAAPPGSQVRPSPLRLHLRCYELWCNSKDMTGT